MNQIDIQGNVYILLYFKNQRIYACAKTKIAILSMLENQDQRLWTLFFFFWAETEALDSICLQ